MNDLRMRPRQMRLSAMTQPRQRKGSSLMLKRLLLLSFATFALVASPAAAGTYPPPPPAIVVDDATVVAGQGLTLPAKTSSFREWAMRLVPKRASRWPIHRSSASQLFAKDAQPRLDVPIVVE